MNVLVRASELGVVTRREIESGLVRVCSAPEASRVHSIVVHGHVVAYVKGPRPGEPGPAESMQAERVTLSRAGAADLGPRLLTAADDDLLWLSALPGQWLGTSGGNGGAGGPNVRFTELAEICQAWGASLAALHRVPVPQSGWPAAPGPNLPQAARTVSPHRVNSYGANRYGANGYGANGHEASGDVVAQAIASDRRLRRVVDDVDQSWTQRHWIHGDLAAEHVIVEPWPSLQVRFVGFGRAGLGDAGWDLAGCLETIAELVRGTSPGVSGGTRSRAQESLLSEYFLHAYRRAGGPGRIHPAVQAAHALSSAWRTATRRPGADPVRSRQRVLRHLERAHELAARGDAEPIAA